MEAHLLSLEDRPRASCWDGQDSVARGLWFLQLGPWSRKGMEGENLGNELEASLGVIDEGEGSSICRLGEGW